MTAVQTLAELRTRVRQAADMENSDFVTTSEVDGYINEGLTALYDLLVSKNQDFYAKDPPSEFTVAQGASSIALPADFYKLVGLDRSVSGDEWTEVRPFNFNDRNDTGRRGRGGVYGAIRRRIVGQKIILSPVALAAGTYRLWYVPTATLLVAAADTFDGVNGWERYVVVDAAIKCLAKEESDTTKLERELMTITRRIDELAAERDVGDTDTVTDVRGGRDPYSDGY